MTVKSYKMDPCIIIYQKLQSNLDVIGFHSRFLLSRICILYIMLPTKLNISYTEMSVYDI